FAISSNVFDNCSCVTSVLTNSNSLHALVIKKECIFAMLSKCATL
ncbi:14629_t:CDS:1, partial [Entrophospora sp. SA101]